MRYCSRVWHLLHLSTLLQRHYYSVQVLMVVWLQGFSYCKNRRQQCAREAGCVCRAGVDVCLRGDCRWNEADRYHQHETWKHQIPPRLHTARQHCQYLGAFLFCVYLKIYLTTNCLAVFLSCIFMVYGSVYWFVSRITQKVMTDLAEIFGEG